MKNARKIVTLCVVCVLMSLFVGKVTVNVSAKTKAPLKDGTYVVMNENRGKISGGKYTVKSKIINQKTDKTYKAKKRTFVISKKCRYGYIINDEFNSISKKEFIEDYMPLGAVTFAFKVKNGKIVEFSITPAGIAY